MMPTNTATTTGGRTDGFVGYIVSANRWLLQQQWSTMVVSPWPKLRHYGACCFEIDRERVIGNFWLIC